MNTNQAAAPLVPPGWEGAADQLTRFTDPSGEAIAWLASNLGANCVGYAVRQPAGWVQILDAGSPQALADRPTRFGCPILCPFPGHVRDARYRWAGIEYALPPHVPGVPPQYSHGFVARLPWRIERTGSSGVEGEFLTTHDLPGGASAAGYPFAVRLRLAVRLSSRALVITLAATNEGDVPAPVGLGLHPYFAIAALGGDRAQVRVALPGQREHVLCDRIPTGERCAASGSPVTLPPLGQTVHMPRTDLGPHPTATLAGPASGVRVVLSLLEGCRDLLLFAPPTESSVSLEPLSTAPGAASQPEGHPDGLVALEPGATRRLVAMVAVEAGPST
jgi:aldose 1-epimerase